LGQLGNFSKDAFWPHARFFAVQRGGDGPSGPMVNTPMAEYAHFSDRRIGLHHI